MKFITLFICLILLSSFTSAFPFIISEDGTNVTENKQLVYSIPEEYFNYVNSIYFYSNRFYWETKKVDGYAYVFWNNKFHNCYNGKIWTIQNKKILIHELGHIYELCSLKRNTTTEEFANNFQIK